MSLHSTKLNKAIIYPDLNDVYQFLFACWNRSLAFFSADLLRHSLRLPMQIMGAFRMVGNKRVPEYRIKYEEFDSQLEKHIKSYGQVLPFGLQGFFFFDLCVAYRLVTTFIEWTGNPKYRIEPCEDTTSYQTVKEKAQDSLAGGVDEFLTCLCSQVQPYEQQSRMSASIVYHCLQGIDQYIAQLNKSNQSAQPLDPLTAIQITGRLSIINSIFSSKPFVPQSAYISSLADLAISAMKSPLVRKKKKTLVERLCLTMGLFFQAWARHDAASIVVALIEAMVYSNEVSERFANHNFDGHGCRLNSFLIRSYVQCGNLPY